MLPCAHQEPSSSSRTPQHSCPLHMSTLHVCIHASTHRVHAWPCTKPRPSAAACPARGRRSRAGCGCAHTHAHTEAHGTASGTEDLPVGEKPGMMLTVSVTCITCATRMSALPGALGGQAGSTNTRARRAHQTSLSSCAMLMPSSAEAGSVRTSAAQHTGQRGKGKRKHKTNTQPHNHTCIDRRLSPRWRTRRRGICTTWSSRAVRRGPEVANRWGTVRITTELLLRHLPKTATVRRATELARRDPRQVGRLRAGTA